MQDGQTGSTWEMLVGTGRLAAVITHVMRGRGSARGHRACVSFLGWMLHHRVVGWCHQRELGEGYTEPVCTIFVIFCVSVIISHQVFEKGGGALYGM